MKQALYFTANWCGPCKVMKPKIQALNLPIDFIDVDTNRLVETLGIRNVPTIILMERGEVKQRMVGNNINIETIKQFFN
jgi:thioredoxin 1